ncbi:hypothetical protein FE634_20020 [Nocardioides dongxiaopingii]|nr:hypothetical protein FE634_20020 [Nocardioides sp. S-1144]
MRWVHATPGARRHGVPVRGGGGGGGASRARGGLRLSRRLGCGPGGRAAGALGPRRRGPGPG